MNIFYISVAAGTGAITRLAIMDLSSLSQRLLHQLFPVSTFFTNILVDCQTRIGLIEHQIAKRSDVALISF